MQRQEQDARELAAALGWTVAAVFTDNDLSAFSGKPRPQYRALLEAMDAGAVQGVICWHTDRLHRSPRELEEYIDISERRGVTTQTVKAGEIDLSTPSGRAVARTLGAWARYESEHKSERITRKKLQLAQSGSFSGGPVPFGWTLDGDTTPRIVLADAAEIRKAIAATIAGESIGSIVRDLNGRGVLTRRGGAWTSTSVRNLLLRPTNAGLSAYRGEIVGASTFPAIISEDEWRTVCSIISDPARRSNGGARVRHLLAGLLRCGTCGAAMKTSSRAGGGAAKFYYKCPARGGGHAFQKAEPIEHLISEVVLARLDQPGVLARLNGPQDQERQHGMQSEAATLRGRMDEAAESFAEGLITRKQLEAINHRVQARLEAIGQELAVAGRASVIPSSAADNLRAWWEAAGTERQRAVIDAVLTPFVDPVGKSAPRKFDPDRVRINWKIS
ncbi:recombinase family protein [Arthrobacter sp. H-02-3]|uniref:recombinase family protein n=1 Tax=Arthrobacter sp. H-02-3 TaxID=2703675 RepID=UPI001F406B38|nr:recombinase family protein [Arthrobacter sp. H-02-3]